MEKYNDYTFSKDKLNDFCFEILKCYGASTKSAQITSNVLTECSLFGTDSHGIRLLPIYIKRLKKGLINKTPEIRIDKENNGTSFLLNGDNGLGQYVAHEAMLYCIEKSKTSGGLAVCSVVRSNHFGAASFYAKMAANNNLIGIVMSNGSKAMVPWGSSKPYFGANPIAYGVPTGNDSEPIIFDMASSAIARAKIRLAAQNNDKLPDNVAVDTRGNMTNDPKKALKGALLPMSGPKGYGLVLLFEILSAVLSGAKFGYDSGGLYEDFEKEQGIGHFMMTIPIDTFVDAENYYSRINTLCSDIKNMEPTPGLNKVLLPGDRSRETRNERLIKGIPLNESLFNELNGLGNEVGLSL